VTPNGTVASESDRRDHFKVRSWLIDGEVVCCDERGLARFDVLRRRRNEAVVFLYAFDLLELDGVDLRREPLEVRNPTLAIRLRCALEDALREVQEVQSSANVQNDL